MWKTFWFFGYKIFVKIYDNDLGRGMKELPTVSKFSVWKKGKELANYDRGWDFNELPSFTYKAIIRFLDLIL
ncbi:DUF7678 domain-containing protein [Aneurinibacillus tyrosinisolvens]|uniref:DUF7678 domain-containing protein n=1 Tax=Aneurinibacillus tyrosinisolvens TaxID=1443435 RepID=UPI00063F6494|nr:hypothetical protein [Aneurinibacillus tyrosinisolvens]